MRQIIDWSNGPEAPGADVLLRHVMRGTHRASSIEALKSRAHFDEFNRLVVAGMTRVVAERFLAAHDAADPLGETWSENWWGPGDG